MFKFGCKNLDAADGSMFFSIAEKSETQSFEFSLADQSQLFTNEERHLRRNMLTEGTDKSHRSGSSYRYLTDFQKLQSFNLYEETDIKECLRCEIFCMSCSCARCD